MRNFDMNKDYYEKDGDYLKKQNNVKVPEPHKGELWQLRVRVYHFLNLWYPEVVTADIEDIKTHAIKAFDDNSISILVEEWYNRREL